MARPLKPIDAEQVFKLAQLGCTLAEIGEFFGCSDQTISNRFLADYELGKASQKTSIRRWQMKKGKAGCSTMLIHLGKTYLGQTDRIDVNTTQSHRFVDRASNPRDYSAQEANGHANGTNGHG